MTSNFKRYGGLRRLAALTATVCAAMTFTTARAYEYRVHCAEDTLRAHRILETVAAKGGNMGERMVNAALELAGTPWAPPADNDTAGTVVVNLHGMDRLGFINNVMALAEAAGKSTPRVRDYEEALESYSRRKGEDDGFASQLIYGADWIVDNIYRGHIKEMTEYLGGGGFKTKTLDHVTRNKGDYPAMADPAVYDKVRMNEMGYRSHRIPHMKKQSIANKPLHELMRDGDLVMLLAPDQDFDIYDIGVVHMKGGEPYLIHISHENGNVVEDPYPAMRLFKIENQHFYGYRWLRPEE